MVKNGKRNTKSLRIASMNKKTYFYTFLTFASFILIICGFYLFFKSPYFLVLDTWVKANIVTYVIFLFLYKTVGVLFPPVPGGIVTLASIPFLGWFNAYLIDFLGSICGGVIAYYLAKKYGHPLLLKIFGEDVATKIENIKVRKNREIEAVFMYRLALGSTILEAVYYGAGFIKIGFINFLVGSILSHTLVGVPTFFLANNILNGENIILTIAVTLIGIVFVLFTKGRYFE
jgi:uncharacterized membrane protein YdjX (TVP38/TMEM64 family)